MEKSLIMSDIIEKIGDSIIQHGKESNRIYLMEYASSDGKILAQKLIKFATEKGYTKIFAKVPKSHQIAFINQGYEVEAEIKNYCEGKTDYVFFGKYFDKNRKTPKNSALIKNVISTALEKKNDLSFPKLDSSMHFRALTPNDKKSLAALYKNVFITYPFPIHKEEYIEETMAGNVSYFGIFDGSNLIAASSSEKNNNCKNAEMTDFAVLTEYRGQNLSSFLLYEMEKVMKIEGFKTLYTIARSVSFGMNTAFAKSGYHFSGTLYSNTQIAGNLENMNVWYKNI